MFLAENPHFSQKCKYHCINNYDKTIGPSLAFNIRIAMICEFFEPDSPDSCVILLCSWVQAVADSQKMCKKGVFGVAMILSAKKSHLLFEVLY